MDNARHESADSFRAELRNWLGSSVPAAWRQPGFWHRIPDHRESVELRRDWERQRFEAGFAGVDWPQEYGGRGGDAVLRAVHDEEMARAHAPVGSLLGITYMGAALLGPTLLRFGTERQKRQLLPDILSGATIWGQGFSEPEAGSDLAGLRTTAVREGEYFTVNGQKSWTSFAQDADRLFALVRTSRTSRKQDGITFLLMDLRAAGVSVRPIMQMSGSVEFGEEFFTDVHVPVDDNVLGEIDDGWRVAKYLLSVERNASPIGHYTEFREELREVVHAARQLHRDGAPASEHADVRDRVAACLTDLELLRVRSHRVLSTVSKGGDLGSGASVTKLHWSATRSAIAELGAAVAGLDGQLAEEVDGVDVAELRWRHLHIRGQRIAGGTAQVQRSIVAQQLLGMPR
jgi:alkylation response protein AidB-like acyl-CoA dehydrogenase